jgi:hypothetical protein
VWNLEKIDAQNPKVTTRQAHNFLKRWRDAPDNRQMDMFDCAHFGWIGYIKNHPHKAAIIPIGMCIIGFGIARLAIVDLNLHKARVDFVAHRDDHNVVRLHPSQKSEARPVITPAGVDHGGAVVCHGARVESGRGEHAVSFSAGAGTKGKDGKGGGKNTYHFQRASIADIPPPSEVRLWLAERAAKWPDLKFTFNVTEPRPLYARDVPFPWHYFVTGVPALLALQPSEDVWVVWFDERAALHFKSEQGREVVADLGCGGWRVVKVLDGHDDVSRINWKL